MILEPVFGVYLAKGRDVVGYKQHLFNFPRVGYIMSHSVQTVQPPKTEHVVRKDEAILREGPKS